MTTRTDQRIDYLTKYKININDTLELNFRNSIKASFNELKLQDKNVKMSDLLKQNKSFITFKLDLSKLNLLKINSVEVSLD